MKFTYTCKKVSLNDSIKDYAEKKISKLEKYFREETEAAVTFAVEKDHLCTVELTIRGNGPLLRAETSAPDGDMRGAVDAAVGYIERQIRQVKQYKKMETKKIPENINYDDIDSLRLEARQKLIKFKPVSVGQASRISGVSPADISVLLVYLEHYKDRSRE